MLKLKTELSNFVAVWSGEVQAVKEGVTRAIDAASVALQQDVRAATIAAGLGQGIANAWRRQRYPEHRPSLRAAAIVWSRAPRVIDAFNRGSLIRGHTGNWLCIPLPAAGADTRNKRITPKRWEASRNMKLRFVYLRGKAKALLIADSARVDSRGVARRRVSRSRKTGYEYSRLQGAASVPVFLLLRQVKLDKRLDLDRLAGEAAAVVASQITRELG